MILRSFCSSNSAAKSSFHVNQTHYPDNPSAIPDPTKNLLNPASLPLWCDLTVLPEIPLGSSDKEHEHLKYAATYLGQQEFNSCGLDNVILLQDVPLVSKSGGYLMSLSSCQTKLMGNANTHDEIFAPIQAIPSTFLLFLNTANIIEESQLLRVALHPSENEELTELEVTFDFLEAESVFSETWKKMSENITLEGEWETDKNTFRSSEEAIVASEALKSENHEQILLVIKSFAEKEAREMNQLLAGLAAVAVALIGSYVWLAVSILKKKNNSRIGKKTRYFDTFDSSFVDIKSPPVTFPYTSFHATTVAVEQMGQHFQSKESVVDEVSAIIPDPIADNAFSSSEASYIDKVIIIQSRVRRIIECDKATRKLALILQLQSIFRGYLVRSRIDWFEDRVTVAKQKDYTYRSYPLADVLKVSSTSHGMVVAPLGKTKVPTNKTEEPPPVYSIVFDHCQELFDESTEDEGEIDHVLNLGGESHVSRKPNHGGDNPNGVATDFDAAQSPIQKIDRCRTQRHNFSCEPQQASSKSLHSDFSLELHSLLMARRLNTAGGDLKSCLDDEARAKCQNSLTESVSLFECHLLPPIERSHSLSQVQHSKVYPNVQELSPMSKVAEQWTMSKDTRRKNRRPPKKGFIAPLSHPLSNEYSVEIVVPIALKVRGGRDDDNKTITDCNELKRRPSLSSVLPGSSPGGSLLCPTSSSEAEESFLKDYW